MMCGAMVRSRSVGLDTIDCRFCFWVFDGLLDLNKIGDKGLEYLLNADWKELRVLSIGTEILRQHITKSGLRVRANY